MGKFNPMDDIERMRYSDSFDGVNPSITDSSTFWFESARQMADTFSEDTGHFLYGRHSSPSTVNLGQALAALEGTEAANVTASGMGAITSVIMELCQTGDHIVASRTVYGGTYAFMKNFLVKYGIETTFVDTTNLEQVEKAIRPNTKVLYFESVSNPLLDISDIPALTAMAHKRDIKVVVDNTFSPLTIAPAQLGADVVVHSLTKYINGASDAIGGVVCGTQDFINALRDVNTGATMLLGPTMDNLRAASILKNLQTLGIRVKQHSKNAAYLAERFQNDGLRVVYPGLSSHPSYELYKSMGNLNFGYGGMMTVDAGSAEKAFAFMEEMQKEKLGFMAVSLGFYRTLFSASGTSTSSEIPEDERNAMGLTDGLIRFSIGLDEDIEKTYQTMKKCMEKTGVLMKVK